MSRRGFAIGVGLLASTLSASAVAQQPQSGYLPQQNPAQMNSQPTQPGYSQVSAPVGHPVGYSQDAYAQQGVPQAAYAQSGCGQPGCTTCGTAAYGHGGYAQGYGQCGDGQCGQEPSKFWTSYYRNTRWPLPFRAQDVSAVTQHFDIQRENGWRMHNTVGHAMFDQRTNALTQAGRNHIQSILRDNPSNRKVVFVLQGQNPKQTSARVQSTELAISELLPVGDLPPVYVTDRDAPGSSGAYQTAVNRALMGSVPLPRLTSGGAAAGGASSGSGGAAGSSGP